MGIHQALAGPVEADAFNDIRLDIAEARHMPGWVYSSPAIFEREKQTLFSREWLMACRDEELPNVGDYVTLNVMGEEVLIARQADRSLAALANVCRHRGVPVAMGTGNVRLFTCPYHAWTYELSGKLRGAPHFRQNREALEGCDLFSYHLAIWRGCVFINLSDEPRDFDEFIAPFEREFGFLQLERCHVARKVVFDMSCNWKLCLENLVDIYHVGTVHAKSFGGAYKGNKENFGFNLLPDGCSSFFENAAPLTKDGKTLVGQVPWLADRDASFAALGLLWPNFRISARSDYFRIWNIWPVAPNRTLMLANMLFPEAALEQDNFESKLDEYETFFRGAIEEDRHVVEALQRAVSSERYIPGPLAKMEEAIHHFLNHYADRVTA